MIAHHRLLLALGLAVSVRAQCPCAGHGSCVSYATGLDEQPVQLGCKCHPRWTGSDCTLRECPTARAWVSQSGTRDYEECAGKGRCNRKTGLCECTPGFTGGACQRTTCPGECSGHGTCETLGELAAIPYFERTNMSYVDNSWRSYDEWDAGRIRGCNCDPEYTGIDCSKRMCPVADDPYTEQSKTGARYLEDSEVQKVSIRGMGDVHGEFTLTYIDFYGGRWTTRPIRHQIKFGTEYSTKLAASVVTATTGYFHGEDLASCPYNDKRCQDEFPEFGRGSFEVGDRITVTAASQSNPEFTVISGSTATRLYVSPAPVAQTTAEATTITTHTTDRPYLGRQGVENALESLPGQIIPNITVSETRPSEGETNYMITFHQEFTHLAGDQAELECNPVGCDLDGCQPRFSGLKSSFRTIVDANSEDGAIVFTVNSGSNDDTIAVTSAASPGPFGRSIIPGDSIYITGTTSNNAATYTVNAISTDGLTLTVDETVVAETYSANDVMVDVTRGFNDTYATMEHVKQVIPGPLKQTGAPVGTNNVEYTTTTDGFTILVNSDVDPLLGVETGSFIKASQISSATYSSTHVDQLYRVVGQLVEVETVGAASVSESQSGDTSTFSLYQSSGTCTVSQVTRGTAEKAECANRGKCNEDTGTCECFEGYAGFDCTTISPVF